MVKRPGLTFINRGCPRCGGDAYVEAAGDDPEWRCLQCGRTIPAAALEARGPRPAYAFVKVPSR